MLSTDLEKLHDEIFAVAQLGIPWTVENYGCSREELEEWRRFSIKLLQDLTEKKKRDDLESTTIVEAYRANVKLKKLPMIKKGTWAEWYTRWNSESKFIKDEWSRLKTIQGCISEEEDIQAGKQLTTTEALLSYLTRTWGTMDRPIPKLILELQNLQKPKDKRDSKYQTNLSKIATTLVVVELEKALGRLECMVIEQIISSAFPDEIVDT